MSTYKLTKLRFKDGVWQGSLQGEGKDCPPPQVSVTVLDIAVDGVNVIETDETNQWLVDVPVPDFAVGDGVFTFLLHDAASSQALGSFTLMGGDVLADDIRVEMALLREELDMLKRAFRRHCVETM